MARENTDDLFFDLEIDKFEVKQKEHLSISLFKEIEDDLCDRLTHSSIPEDDQTDGPLDFTQNIVDNVRAEFEQFVEDSDKKIFLRILSKIFRILFSVKADNSEKIIRIVKFSISTVPKTRSGQN